MKNKFFSKVAATVSAVLLLATACVIPASAAKTVNTALLNKGFFDTTKLTDYKGREMPNGWQQVEGNVVDFEAAADVDGVVIDNTALKLDFNKNLVDDKSGIYSKDYNWFGYYQNVKIEKNTDYTFSFWVLRNKNATSAVALGEVKTFDGGLDLIKLEATNTRGGWEYISGKFNTGNNDAVTVRLFTYAVGVDSTDMVVYFDYVDLVKGETVVPDTRVNLVANGKMEEFADVGTNFERLSDWQYDFGNFDGSVKVYDKTDGVIGSAVTATNRKSWLGQIFQTVTLEENTDYDFSFTYKSNHTDVVIVAYILPEMGTNDSNDKLIHLENALACADTWQTSAGTFNSEDITEARIVIRYYKNDATLDETYNFSIDDVILTEHIAPIVANGDMEVFYDVGTNFERLSDWQYDFGNFDGTVKAYDKTDGVIGSAVTATNRKSWLGQIFQTVTLEANTDYTFSFYEKSNHTDVVMVGYIIPENGSNDSDAKLIHLEKGIAAADTWQQLSGSFNSGDVTNARIVLRYYKNNAALDPDYTFSFDEVSIEKAEPHTHTYAYTDNGAAGHTKYCLGCEEATAEEHTFTRKYFTATATQAGKVFESCADCGHIKESSCAAFADVNGDGSIEITDLIRIKKYLAQIDGTNIAAYSGDINGDEEINAADIISLRRILLSK